EACGRAAVARARRERLEVRGVVLGVRALVVSEDGFRIARRGGGTRSLVEVGVAVADEINDFREVVWRAGRRAAVTGEARRRFDEDDFATRGPQVDAAAGNVRDGQRTSDRPARLLYE